MGLFNRKKQKSNNELTPVKVKPLSIRYRLQRLKAKKKLFKVEVTILYDGKPVVIQPFKVQSYSRDQAAKDVQDKMTIKVVSAHEIKQK